MPGAPIAGMPFDIDIKEFVAQEKWTYARTMPEWPHEYIVRGKVDEILFVKMVKHIRQHGYQGYFYRRPITYFYEDGIVSFPKNWAIQN